MWSPVSSRPSRLAAMTSTALGICGELNTVVYTRPMDVHEARLPNGLRVLTRELHHAPVATFWVWYGVGGRNELPGQTGVSHWVEHMLFKGTEQFRPGDIFRQVTKNGGTLNGFTWIDYTTYFETLPSDRLELA